MAEEPAVDVRALVADIESEVARRRAAGEYPEELLERLRAEFRVADEQPALDEMAHIETVRPLESMRAGVGPAVVFSKRVLRRLVAWYVRPIAEDQSRFNYALLREIKGLDERLGRVETAWRRPPGAPAAHLRAAGLGDELDAAREAAVVAALDGAPQGRVAVIGLDGAGLMRRLLARGVSAELVTPDAARLATARAAGVRCHDAEPLAWLEAAGPTLTGVVGTALLPMLAPAELLRVAGLVAGALRPGGCVIVDAPDPGAQGWPRDAGDVDPALRRWVSADTAALLCEAAGLEEVRTVPLGGRSGDGARSWYAVTARRGTGGSASPRAPRTAG